MRAHTPFVGAMRCRVPLTKEYSSHGLAEESLTLFPNGMRCPAGTPPPHRGAIVAVSPGFARRDIGEFVG